MIAASVVTGSSRSVASSDANECRSACTESRSSPPSSPAVFFCLRERAPDVALLDGLPVDRADAEVARPRAGRLQLPLDEQPTQRRQERNRPPPGVRLWLLDRPVRER